MVRQFLRAISRDWGSIVTGGASIPLTVLAFWANTPLQRTAWAIFAITCFVVASFRIWAFEYRRAEAAETQLTIPLRPWVTIDGYSSVYNQDEETGEEYLSESVHIVNRGQGPAVSIVIPNIQLVGRTARLFSPLPTLGPGEGIDAEVLNLRATLERVRDKMPKSPEGGPWSLRLPLVVEYRSLDHNRWATEHTILFSVHGINFAIAHPNDQKQLTDLSLLGQQPATGAG